MNYRTKSVTFVAAVRIAQRLAASTGISRLVWANRRGRVYIIAEGPKGYHRSSTGLVGHVPGRNHRGELVECSRC